MTSVPKWKAGTLYPPGSVVVPNKNVAAGALPAFNNPGFETGDDTGWAFDAGVSVTSETRFSGTYCVKFTGSSGGLRCFSDLAPATPGMKVSASAQYKQGSASSGENVGYVTICWLDSAFALLREDLGNGVSSGSGGAWHPSSVTAIAPANTAWVRVCGLSNRSDSDASYFDDFTWTNGSTVTEGLIFRAVQPATGRSGTTEPAWPTSNGVQVIDNEVIWEAFLGSRITWKATPILKSGPTEPDWRTENGSITEDNTIAWLLDTRVVTDPKCPNSTIVLLDQNKIYAADEDIIPFCALNNPFDWSTENNAGYLPFGNGKYGSTPVSALGMYRGRLEAFNLESMQDWQIDPDPALNQRLNTLPIGCPFHKSFSPASNDAMLLTSVGIRSLGLAASTSNLNIGDAGTAVDALVKPLIYRGAGKPPLEGRGLYIPSAGQYWLIFVGDEARVGTAPVPNYADYPDVPYDDMSLVYVYAISSTGKIGAWQRYYFPFPIHAAVAAQSPNGSTVLAVRSGEKIIHISDSDAYTRDNMVPAGESVDPREDSGNDISSRIQWAWLEMGGAIGQDKTTEALDIVGRTNGAVPFISMGWDENDPDAFTEPYELQTDTVPKEPIAFELTAPSISVRLEYNGGNWKFSALNVYLQDSRLAK